MGADVIFRALGLPIRKARTRFVVMRGFRYDMTAGGRVAAPGKTLSIPAARPYFAAALALSVPHRLTGFFCDRQLRCKRRQKFQFRGTVHLKQSLATLCRSGA